MAKILVVEDDPQIANLIRLYLRREHHDLTVIDNGLHALQTFAAAPTTIDLIILDLMLPGLDGRGVCRRIRESSTVPIIMLTALDDSRDKLEGFDLGADDYLTKPFDPDELVARVRAILRRSQQVAAPGKTDPHTESITLGNLTLIPSSRRLTVNDDEISLRTKEFDLLLVFARNLDLVLSRDQLFAQVWGSDFDGDSRTVDVHISRLRDRLRAAHAAVEIETLRSVGYRLTIV